MVLLVFLLISYGASNIMIYGSIFSKFRDMIGVNDETPGFFGKLFGCMMCLPFWWGVILSNIGLSPSYFVLNNDDFGLSIELFINKYIIYSFLDGCISSGGVWLIHTIQEFFENHNN